MLSCQGRKCSVVSCYSAVKGAHRGAPFCRRHLAETARSPSPARKTKGAETALTSALRLQSQQTCPEQSGHGDSVPVKQVAFSDQGRSPGFEPHTSSPRTPSTRRRSSTACVERDTFREGEGFPAGTLVLARLWPFFGKSKDRKWFIYQGRSQGVAADSRRNERVAIHLPMFRFHGSV